MDKQKEITLEDMVTAERCLLQFVAKDCNNKVFANSAIAVWEELLKPRLEQIMNDK